MKNAIVYRNATLSKERPEEYPPGALFKFMSTAYPMLSPNRSEGIGDLRYSVRTPHWPLPARCQTTPPVSTATFDGNYYPMSFYFSFKSDHLSEL